MVGGNGFGSFIDSMANETLFARRFFYNDIEYNLIHKLDIKVPDDTVEKSKLLNWVLACKVLDGVPGNVVIVPCDINKIWEQVNEEAKRG
jgi:hypothetical protein